MLTNASATTDPVTSQLGTSVGGWARANGTSSTAALDIPVAARAGPEISPIFTWENTCEPAKEIAASTSTPIPTNVDRSGSGCSPAITPTPTRPSTKPTRRQPVTRSDGTTMAAMATTKMGMVATVTAAIPESTRFSLQATRVNGIALSTPMTTPGPAARRSSCAPAATPDRQRTKATMTGAAIHSRMSAIVAGSSSRTATRMNMNCDPTAVAPIVSRRT